ncbi:unnamed protein product [Arctia plantaginis]|uniref:Uncharacterized protein n=1 Tax=Arctia plantaginis TaxID=874455 RepID=A0A8S1BA29_ARCPL|nr:unnamed protein product [Arctia plantaginis]
MILKYTSIFILLFYCYIGGAQGSVRLQSSGPTVLGANITLSATLVDEYPGVLHKFVFRNVEKGETFEILSSQTVVNYTVKISREKYDVGLYAFEVRVYRKNKYKRRTFSLIASDRIRVSVTELLNGKLKLVQNGFDRSYGRIFPNERVSHIIELSNEELQFLTDDNTYLVHWYIDCSLISSTGLSFDYTYENRDKTYNLEALVEVEHSKFSNGTSTSSLEELSGFKCAPIYSSGYTYGYYKARVRADAADGSPPPPRATSENPSNTWQDSSSPDSTTERSIGRVQSGGDKGYVRLRSSGPTVRGANLTLTVTIVDDYPGAEHKFVFRNIKEEETVEILSSEAVVNHTLKLSKYKYEAGNAEFEVAVYGRKIFNPNKFRYLGSDVIKVPVTELLNGKLKLIQNGFDRSYGRIFPNERVSHIIELSQEELQFLTDDNTYLVHWYIDCSLISSTGLSFDYTYENRDKTYILEALVEVEHNQNSSAPRVIGRRADRLSGFKCAPIYRYGYTYGYYKASVRADATDGSPPPPTVAAEYPSNTWQGSGSSDRAIESSPRPWRTTPRSPWRDERVWNASLTPTFPESKPFKNSRTTERSTLNTIDSGDHKNCITNGNNALISIKDGHMKLAMDLVFHGTLNISSFQVEGN